LAVAANAVLVISDALPAAAEENNNNNAVHMLLYPQQ
jgi:hypothetical protein